MIVPPALPSGGHAELTQQTGHDFLRLQLEGANMRVPRHIRFDCLILGGMEAGELVAFDENDDGACHAGFAEIN